MKNKFGDRNSHCNGCYVDGKNFLELDYSFNDPVSEYFSKLYVLARAYKTPNKQTNESNRKKTL